MIEIDEAEKTLKFFQYDRIYLSDDNCYFIKIYSDIYCKNN